MTNIFKHTLPNGVRVLCENVDYVKSAAIGLWCRTGSRDEHENEGGITHLIEHMLFKGTEARTSKQIAESIEGRGGALNAFTDKEATCYYCKVLSDDVENGVDVLSDMVLHSKFDPTELAKEQDVVLEEIKRSEDEPGDHVHELHMGSRWGQHALGKPILGTPESVNSFGSQDLKNYVARQYRGENVLLAVAGNVEPEKIVELAEKMLGSIASGAELTKLDAPKANVQNIYQTKDVEQVHFCIGADGVSLYDPRYYVMVVLDSLLGGSMSSRLFQEVREKRGLVYSIGSYSVPYTVGGTFTIYGGTSLAKWPELQNVVSNELAKLRTEGPNAEELERTKRYLAGNLVLALEGMSGRMMRMSRNEFNHGRVVPIEETLSKINAVTANEVQDLAQDLLRPESISTTAIGPA